MVLKSSFLWKLLNGCVAVRPSSRPRNWNLIFGFRIPIVNEILHSSSKIQDAEAQDFWFHRQKFPILVNPDYLQREDQSLKCDSQDIDIRRE